MQVSEDDEVGEVRPGQEQGPRVRQQERSIEERRLALAAAPSRVDEHRRQKGDGGIQVEQRRHEADDRDRAHEDYGAGPRRLRQLVPDESEQSVVVCNQTD
jgi:hypothetical protein